MGNYDSDDALKLLGKDEASVLQLFHECETNPLKSLSPEASIEKHPDVEHHMISLIRMLLKVCNPALQSRPYAISRGYRYCDNLDLLGGLVGAVGANRFGMFDAMLMQDALSKAKVFESNSSMIMTDTRAWSMDFMEILPIGCPEGYLVGHP